MKDRITTIRVHENTVNRLKELGSVGNTIEEVILKIIDVYEGNQRR